MSDSTVSKEAIIIERIFDAPVDLVWKMWIQPELFKKWYGPQGFTVPVAEMDVRIGGKRLVCMASPDGSMKIWTTGEYTEIVPNQRLVYTDCPADEHGSILSPSALGINDDDQNPLITEVTVLLEDLDGRTKMVMTHTGLPADDKGANEGWEQAFTKMASCIQTVLEDKS